MPIEGAFSDCDPEKIEGSPFQVGEVTDAIVTKARDGVGSIRALLEWHDQVLPERSQTLTDEERADLERVRGILERMLMFYDSSL